MFNRNTTPQKLNSGKDFDLKSFTLAEIISVVLIMGIIAVLTIPVAVNKSINTVNRTKVKKAMAAYDRALSKWYIEEANISYAEDYHDAYELDKNTTGLVDLSKMFCICSLGNPPSTYETPVLFKI